MLINCIKKKSFQISRSLLIISEIFQMLLKIVCLGIFSLLLVTTYSSFSTIITQIHQKDNHRSLGPILLFANYAVFMISNTFVPSLGMTYKNQFLLASLCYTANYMFQLASFDEYTMYIFSILGALLGGFGASVFWISLGGYMDLLCQQMRESQKGKYFGILNAFVFANILIGALITTFALGFFNQRVYFGMLTIIGVISLILGWLTIEDIQTSETELRQIQEKKSRSNLMILMKSIRFYPIMKAVIPLLVIDGITIALTNSIMLQLMNNSSAQNQDDNQNIKAGMVLFLHGFGAIIGGYTSSLLTDKIKTKTVGYMIIGIVLITCAVTAILAKFYVSFTSASIGGFLWGITLYFLQGWMFVVCSKIYGGDTEAFAVNKQVHSFSFCLFQLALIITNDHINIIVVVGIITLFVFPATYMLGKLPLDISHKVQSSPPELTEEKK